MRTAFHVATGKHVEHFYHEVTGFCGMCETAKERMRLKSPRAIASPYTIRILEALTLEFTELMREYDWLATSGWGSRV